MGRSIVILVRQNGLGSVQPGDAEFGLEMFDKLIHTFEKADTKPSAICFYTEGVKLACEDSPALLGLKLLQGMGVRIVVCQTCLVKYGLTDKLLVGEVGGMNDIVAVMASADSVITV